MHQICEILKKNVAVIPLDKLAPEVGVGEGGGLYAY